MAEIISGRHQLYSGTQDATEFVNDFRLLDREPYFHGSRLFRGDVFGDPIPVRTSPQLPNGYMRLLCIGTGEPITVSGEVVNYSINGGAAVENAEEIPAAPTGVIRVIDVWGPSSSYTNLAFIDGGIFDIEFHNVHVDSQFMLRNQPITMLDLTGLVSASRIILFLTELESIFGLSGVGGLTLLDTSTPKLKKIDLSGASGLEAYLAVGTLLGGGTTGALEAVRAVGVGSSFDGSSYYGGLSIQHQRLSAAALNQVYEDLAPDGQGQVSISGNPGAADSDVTIATAKGYTVFGA